MIATAIALTCTLAGVPQILTMIRARSSSAQSPLGWAMGMHGAGASIIVGMSKGVATIIYAPSMVGLVIASIGLMTVLRFRDGTLIQRLT